LLPHSGHGSCATNSASDSLGRSLGDTAQGLKVSAEGRAAAIALDAVGRERLTVRVHLLGLQDSAATVFERLILKEADDVLVVREQADQIRHPRREVRHVVDVESLQAGQRLALDEVNEELRILRVTLDGSGVHCGSLFLLEDVLRRGL
jgi:hypothetical protein